MAGSRLLEESASDADQNAQDQKRVIIDSWAIASRLGDLALLSISCAFLLMPIFAVKNASLL